LSRFGTGVLFDGEGEKVRRNRQTFVGKIRNSALGKHGPPIAWLTAMSAPSDSLYERMAASLEAGGAGRAQEANSAPACYVSPAVAHELNNILMVIQGNADRLRLKHGEDPALNTPLKLIAEAARRAATLVRSATPPTAGLPIRPQSNPSPSPAA
jgi:signal transduction histidine kinase